MQRDKWTFEFTAAQLADAAKAKVEHHAARLKFWTEAQDQVMADVKKDGLSIEVSSAGRGYSASNSGMAPEISIDMTYQRKLQEANQKIEEHRAKHRDYNGWLQVLLANQGRTYNLNADDYLFFFGK